MIYSPGNAAKQWIFEELDAHFKHQGGMIFDLCCGTGQLWKSFLETHPGVRYQGIDFDNAAIQKAQHHFQPVGDRVTFLAGDAQAKHSIQADIATAFSAIEHVLDRKAFLQTVFDSLVPGGKAYLNYDAGHFRSHDIKERVMVPVSQLLAYFGYEQSYMKKVDDRLFRQQAQAIGFQIIETRKHNMSGLKRFMRGKNLEAVQAWYTFEERMGKLYSPEDLDVAFLSTTLVLRKP